MAKLTVIDGNGPPRGPRDREGDYARHFLRMTIIEVLRALVRGDDPENKIAKNLSEFSKHASISSTPLHAIVETVISEMHQSFVRHSFDDPAVEIERIMASSLQVVAEMCCDDNGASGRRSRREWALLERIEHHLIERERRSREQGRSYFQSLTERHFPKQRKRNPKK